MAVVGSIAKANVEVTPRMAPENTPAFSDNKAKPKTKLRPTRESLASDPPRQARTVEPSSEDMRCENCVDQKSKMSIEAQDVEIRAHQVDAAILSAYAALAAITTPGTVTLPTAASYLLLADIYAVRWATGNSEVIRPIGAPRGSVPAIGRTRRPPTCLPRFPGA